MVNNGLKKAVFSFFSIIGCFSAALGAGPYWDVKPATWTTGAYLSYPVAFKGPNPIIDVTAYGARGDGATDDIVAIREAIAVSTANAGGIVYFPEGTYMISDEIIVPSNVTIQCAGPNITTIKGSTNIASGTSIIRLGPNATQNYTEAGGGTNVEIRDCGIDGTNTSGVSYRIAAFGVDYFKALNLNISSTSSYGIIVQGSTTTLMESPLVAYCRFKRCGREGGSDTLGGGNNADARYVFNTFEDCYGTAIDNVNTTRALWLGNRSINNDYGTGSMWSDYAMTDSQIIGNYIEGGSIHIFGNLGPGLTGSPNNVKIAFNHLKNSSSGAILVSPSNQVSTDTNKVEGLVVTGNLIEGATDYAINIGDAPGCIISFNQINEWDAGSSGASAINLDAGVVPTIGSTQCVVMGNTGRYGNSTLWYRENASASQAMNNQISGNLFPGGTYTILTNTPISTFMQSESGTFGFGGSGSGVPSAYLDVRGTGGSNVVAVSTKTSGSPTAFAISNAGAVSVTNTLSVTGTSTLGTVSAGALSATSVTDSGLTSGRVPFASTGGLLSDSASFLFDGTNFTLNGAIQSNNDIYFKSNSESKILSPDQTERIQIIDTGINITTADGIQIGSPTGGAKGESTINIASDVYKNDSAYTNPDYALEHWVKGKIVKFIDNPGAKNYPGRMPLKRLEKYIRKYYQLPRISNRHGIFDRSDAVLEKIEELFTYIIDLNKKIEDLNKKINVLRRKNGIRIRN